MPFDYYWTAIKLLLKRDITIRTFVRVLKEKPEAVCGRGGSFGLTDLEMNNSNPGVTIEIIKSHTPAGSAIDGEYAWATFKVLTTGDGKPISKTDMQSLIHKWNFDCELQRFGNIGATDVQAGVMVFVDDYPPNEGDMMALNY